MAEKLFHGLLLFAPISYVAYLSNELLNIFLVRQGAGSLVLNWQFFKLQLWPKSKRPKAMT